MSRARTILDAVSPKEFFLGKRLSLYRPGDRVRNVGNIFHELGEEGTVVRIITLRAPHTHRPLYAVKLDSDKQDDWWSFFEKQLERA